MAPWLFEHRRVAEVRRLIDRLLATVARVVLWGFYRRVEIDGADRLPRGRPVLVVANHFNGFVDPVALTRVLGRVPRFLGKATLWDVKVARPFLALAGVIPIHRAADGATAGNSTAFASCYAALHRGATVAIFPEGTTHDEPHLADLRTGAARIALGARAEGVAGLTVVPVGLVFADKLALRSRIGVRIGPPIEIDEEPAGVTDQDHVAVEALTGRIGAALAGVSGAFADRQEAGRLRRAAEVTLRTESGRGDRSVPLPAREDLAQRLADAPAAERDEVTRRLGEYQLDLADLGVDDPAIEPPRDLPKLAREIALTALALVVLGPLLATGVAVNVVPWLVVRTTSARVAAPVTKGTVRLLTSLVAFPLAWVTFAWLSGDLWHPLAGVGAAAVAGAATVVLVERWAHLWRTWRAYDVQRNARRWVADARSDRAELVAAVRAAVADPATPVAPAGAMPVPASDPAGSVPVAASDPTAP